MQKATSALKHYIIGFVALATGDIDAAIGGSGTLEAQWAVALERDHEAHPAVR